MLKVSLFEVIFRGFPEMFLLFWSMYLIANIKYNLRKHLFSTLISVVVVTLIRMLPIHIGINIILNVILLVYINISINKLNIAKAITLTMLIYIIEFICEIITMVVLTLGFHVNLVLINNNVKLKLLYSYPNFALLLCFAYAIRYIYHSHIKPKYNLMF